MFARLVYYIFLFFTFVSNAQTLEIEWCEVLAGPFTWGAYDEIRSIDYDYQIMKYEVTNAQYVEYLEEALAAGEITKVNSHTVEGYYEGDKDWSAGEYEFLYLDEPECRISYINDDFMIIDGYENHPVFYVTWFGAWAFAKHFGLRLPAEEEWEKAARANTGWDYSWGDDIDGSRANYQGSGDPYDNGTTPVGYYNGSNHFGFQTTDSPSPYGAYDMAGNVQEWSDSTLCGGSWFSYSYYLQCWSRSFTLPNYKYNVVGFRCVKDSITVNINEKQNPPNNYELYQNYPNPFNPSTIIKYSIPRQSFVQLRVFDMLGKEVSTLISKEQSPGSYEVEFRNEGLSSGVYFYQLSTKDFIDSNKMILQQ
ncbi:SUMF1/EgtB/PvdO family nonheme iron enzyme [Bacteroidota bacterium]